jgi:hypothetical protein
MARRNSQGALWPTYTSRVFRLEPRRSPTRSETSRREVPVANAAVGELAAAGVREQIDVVLDDTGYWDSDQIENLAARGMRPLVPPDGQKLQTEHRLKPAKGHATTSCGASSKATPDAPSTANENARSSRSLARSSTTDASLNSSAEASRPADPSGGSSPPPTTSSSSGEPPALPRPPEHHTAQASPCSPRLGRHPTKQISVAPDPTAPRGAIRGALLT